MSQPGQPVKDIVAPNKHDVLCGRGGGTNNHVGNELFRQMVNQKKRSYLNSCKRDKPAVSRGIVQAIRNLDPSGRFLSRDEATGLWYDIGDQKAREKTSQALREGAPEIRKSMGGSVPPPGSLSQGASPTAPVAWHGGHNNGHHNPHAPPPHHDPYFGGGPPGSMGANARGHSINGGGGYSHSPSRAASFASAGGPPPMGHYYGAQAPAYDPYGRQYSVTSAAAGAAAAAAGRGAPLGMLPNVPGAASGAAPARPSMSAAAAAAATPRPGSPGSLLPSHITPDAAKALLQFFKAQQAKAEADPQAASTAVGSHELATALAAATASNNNEAPPSPGRVSAIAAELEALAEERENPKPKLPPQPRAAPSNAAANSDLAHSIAAAAGISPAAASVALQLATRAKELDNGGAASLDRSNVRAPPPTRLPTTRMGLSRERGSYYNTGAAAAAASSDPYAVTAAGSSHRNSAASSSTFGDPFPYRKSVTSVASSNSEGGAAAAASTNKKRDDTMAATSHRSLYDANRTSNAAAAAAIASAAVGAPSMPPMTTEVERRLAVAEHMAQLARSGARDTRFCMPRLVSSSEGEDEDNLPLTRKDREMTLLRKRTAMFQDLGILGVSLSVIQTSISQGKSLTKLLDESRKKPRRGGSFRVDEVQSGSNGASLTDTHMNGASALNGDKPLGETSAPAPIRAAVKMEDPAPVPAMTDAVALTSAPAPPPNPSPVDTPMADANEDADAANTVDGMDIDALIPDAAMNTTALPKSKGPPASAAAPTPSDAPKLQDTPFADAPENDLATAPKAQETVANGGGDSSDAITKPANGKDGDIFSKDMVKSALDSMGANIPVS